jgi:hypothetical protein
MKEQIISQKLKFVPLYFNEDMNTGGDSDAVDMQGMKSATFLLLFNSALAGDAVVKLYSGVTHGAKTTAMTFNYRYGGAAIKSALADVFSAIATSAALTLTGATFVSRGCIIEVNADQMTDGHRYLTLEFDSAASAGEMAVWAILDPMYLSPGGDSVID